MTRKSYRILAIGDNHCPFVHLPTFDKIIEIIPAFKPDIIIDMGDKYDLFSYSRFPKRMNMTPTEELKFAREQAEQMWFRIHKVAPKAKLFQIKGNHDERAYKTLLAKAPELEVFVDFKGYYTFDKVETQHDIKETLEINGTVFTHGHKTKLGDHLPDFEFRNVVCGHSHRGGTFYRRMSCNRIVWELNAGYIGDPFSEALIYRPQKKFFTWTHGVALIDYYGPRFIPL